MEQDMHFGYVCLTTIANYDIALVFRSLKEYVKHIKTRQHASSLTRQHSGQRKRER